MPKRLSRAGAKKKKRNRNRKSNTARQPGTNSENMVPAGSTTWMEDDGVHAFIAGDQPTEARLAEMTKAYQRQIRKSPLFKDWVARFGKKEAIKLLKECRAELR